MGIGDYNDTASFNQAQFQQQRIHEVLIRVDRLNTSPLSLNAQTNNYNYEVMFNDLCSILVTVSAKLKPKEKEDILKMREELQKLLITNPPITKKNSPVNKRPTTRINPENWKKVNELLFKFRMELENLMDAHGLGNPSKSDPRKAIMNQ